QSLPDTQGLHPGQSTCKQTSSSNPARVRACFPYLQEFGSSIRKPKLSQHTDLDLVADRGPFAAVEGIGPLHLLRVPELLQPPDHLLHHKQVRNWSRGKEQKQSLLSEQSDTDLSARLALFLKE
uniref:Uncharacterized protein n=1 Tax=Nothoprocta perdicaria TaxID=30464 RepID=A0A8C6Z251_NOTPE